jgi:putative transposase
VALGAPQLASVPHSLLWVTFAWCRCLGAPQLGVVFAPGSSPFRGGICGPRCPTACCGWCHVRIASVISQIESNVLESSVRSVIFDLNNFHPGVSEVTKLQHYDHFGTVRFTTFSTFRREPAFTIDSVRQLFVDHLSAMRERHHFRLLGYVIMPEHVHLVFWPTDDCMVGRMIGELKSRFARDYFARNPVGGQNDRRVFWQRRCYDHNCRTPHSVWQKVAYCHNNPVKRGLAGLPSDWKWSSYNWYNGVTDVPIAMDVVDLSTCSRLDVYPQQAVGHQE